MMNITYRDLDFGSSEDCGLLARWYNDPEVKHLYSLFTDAESFSKDFTPEYFQRIGKTPQAGGPSRNLMVLLDGMPIGQATFETDTPKLLTKTPHTAWLALIIGDPRLRRCGLGTRITAHLEELAAKSGAQRIEIGVFEYNTRALRFFTSLGYHQLERRPGRVWWDGQMWAEIRFLKTL
jgi:RimJ/RimL family protein N-acetyltransferase